MASRKHGETVEEYEARLLRALGELRAAKATGDAAEVADAAEEVAEVVDEAPEGAETATAETAVAAVEAESAATENSTSDGATDEVPESTTEREPEVAKPPRSEHFMDRRIGRRKA